MHTWNAARTAPVLRDRYRGVRLAPTKTWLLGHNAQFTHPALARPAVKLRFFPFLGARHIPWDHQNPHCLVHMIQRPNSRLVSP